MQKRRHFQAKTTKPLWSGGGIYGEDALSKLSHTATVCVAVFLIDPNPNRFVDPQNIHCMLPSPLCGIFFILDGVRGLLLIQTFFEKLRPLPGYFKLPN